MKLKRFLRSALLFVLAASLLGIIPAAAADDAVVQADYDLHLSALPVEAGDVLVLRAGDLEYSYAVSTEPVRGLDVADSRAYAGDYSAVAGAEGMMLTLSDPDCGGITAVGSWKDSVGSDDITVIFNGEEKDFSTDLELPCELGTLSVGKDGSVRFVAAADEELVTISQSCGSTVCSVSLQRKSRSVALESAASVTLHQEKMPDWVGVVLPDGMEAIPESLSWSQHLQFSVANGSLFCRQTEPFPFKADVKSSVTTHEFTIRQSGALTACGNWSHDIRKAPGILRFNGAGHAYGVSNTVEDGIFRLDGDRWYYTADDTGAGAYQFTSQQRGIQLTAAVGRGEVPEIAVPGGEQLVIESLGRSFTHTMQRLSSETGSAPLEAKLTVTAKLVP